MNNTEQNTLFATFNWYFLRQLVSQQYSKCLRVFPMNLKLYFAIVLGLNKSGFIFNAIHRKFVISIKAYANAMWHPHNSTQQVVSYV